MLAGADVSALARAIADIYVPNRMIIRTQGAPPLVHELIADKKEINGVSAAYICRAFTCEKPETEPAALAARLT